MADSKIEWTDATWNPVIGCAKVSPGCKNCYAEKQAARILHLNKFTGPYLDVIRGADEENPSRWNGRAVFVEDALGKPLRWRTPRRVFVNSMSDLFHEDIAFEQVAAIFGVMAAAPQHTFQVLTKRPARMVEFFRWAVRLRDPIEWVRCHASSALPPKSLPATNSPWPLPNVHIGVSVENQPRADEIIPLLLQCPAALRFLSVEPLLGDVCLSIAAFDSAMTGIGWVIVGGESGPGARACDVAWIRSIIEQCREAGVPVFVKQLGAVPLDRSDAGFDGQTPQEWPDGTEVEEYDEARHATRYQGARVRIKLKDRKGGNPDEWPTDLRVRELPAGAPCG